jgi:predicted ATPase/Tfp pilus assembly protein PilF
MTLAQDLASRHDSGTRLASPATRFVGRAIELTRIESAFAAGASLVTLFGPGGAGKTRLALRFAERRDDARLVDLGGARNVDDVCDLIGHELAVSLPTGPQASIERIGGVLAARPLVLILDNAEHLVGPLRGAIAHWLAVAPHARLLVTSRELLGVTGEHAQEVGPLPLPADGGDTDAEAFELFLDRARLVCVGYQPSPADAAAIVEVLRTLDGLPLAIELAAARVGVLGVREILDRLQTRLDLFKQTGDTVDARHRTLRATIEWSWRLLTPADQHALAQCSVFRGSFSIDAAEHVVDAACQGTTIVDMLESLRSKSLVRASAGADGRVRMRLYDSVRSFAEEKRVAARDEDRITNRYVEYFDRLVTRGLEDGTCGGDARYQRLATDLQDLVAAHRAALAASPPRADVALRITSALRELFRVKGAMGQLAKMLDEAIAVAPDTIDRRVLTVGLVDRALSRLAVDQSYSPDADLERASVLAKGDAMLEGRTLAAFGTVGILRGDLHGAMAQLDQAVSCSRLARDSIGEVYAHERMGLCALWSGDPADARQHLEAAVGCARRSGSSILPGFALALLAWTLFSEGRVEEAHASVRDLLLLARSCESDRLLALALGYEAPILQELGRWDEAEDCYRRALELHRATQGGGQELHVLVNAGSLYHERGRLEEARGCYTEGLLRLRAEGGRIHEGMTWASLAALEGARDQVDSARHALDEARPLLAESKRRVVLEAHEGHVELARVRDRLAAGDFAEAQRIRHRVEERLAALPGAGDEDVRLARRLLSRALREPRNEVLPPAHAWLVDVQGRWFRPPHGRSVRLEGHSRLRALLSALLRARKAEPAGTLRVSNILQQVWPDERILLRAANNRVRVAIAALREAGLRDLITSRPGGYALDAEANVVEMSAPLD